MRKRVLAGALVAAVLAMGGCGQKAALRTEGSVAPPVSAALDTSPTTVTTAPPGAPSTPAPKPTRTTPTTAAATGAPIPGASGMRTASQPDPSKAATPFKLDVDIPDCAEPGGEFPVVVETEVDVDIGMVIQFSDGRAYDTIKVGTSDAAGRYKTSYTISPEVPPGTAVFKITAGAPHHGKTLELPFHVQKRGSQCP